MSTITYNGQEFADELELAKFKKCALVKQRAAELITSTDWRLTKYNEQKALVEEGIRADTDEKGWQVKGERDSFRQQSNAIEAQVAALDSIDAVAVFPIVFDSNPAVPTPVYSKLSSMAFLSRLTGDEYKAIQESTVGSVMLLSAMLETATYIDVKDPRTIYGIQSLATAGLITSERATAILAVGTESEYYLS